MCLLDLVNHYKNKSKEKILTVVGFLYFLLKKGKVY